MARRLRLYGAIGLAVGMSSGAAAARNAEPRLDRALVRPRRLLAIHDGTAMLPAAPMLTSSDRTVPQAIQGRQLVREGIVDVAILAARTSVHETEFNEKYRGSDFRSAKTFGLAAQLPIAGMVRLGARASATRIRRRLVALPVTGRPYSTNVLTAGLTLGADAGPALTLDYVKVAPTGRRIPIERLAELVGGAPMAGRGVSLGFVSRPDITAPGQVQWGVTFTAMARPMSDLAFGNAPGSVGERRSEVVLRLAL